MKPRTRSTGMIVTFQWSRQGHWQKRRQAWGMMASSWGATKLGGTSEGFGLWEIPESVTYAVVEAWLNDNLTQADRVAVVFPHGKTSKGYSAISIHTHNIEP